MGIQIHHGDTCVRLGSRKIWPSLGVFTMRGDEDVYPVCRCPRIRFLIRPPTPSRGLAAPNSGLRSRSSGPVR